MSYGFDDSIDRDIAKKFFKYEHGIDLIDTPDSYWDLSGDSTNLKIRKNGKFDIDLIAVDSDDKTCVEVEKMQLSNYEYEKSHNKVNILVSKYWKYFNDFDESVMLFLVYDGDKFTGKILEINGKDIKDNIDRSKTSVFKTSNKKDGFTEVYSMSWDWVEEYDFIEEKERPEGKSSD